MPEQTSIESIDLVKQNEKLPRFVYRENESEITQNLREYASKRLEEKAQEKGFEVNQNQRDAVRRLTVTTSIMEAVNLYQAQRLEIGKPATPMQIITVVIIALLAAEAGYLHSEDRAIPVEKFTPIIYLSPVYLNLSAMIKKRELSATMVHETEHVVDDILGIRWTRDINEETKGVLGLIKMLLQTTQDEKSAQKQERKLR